ncbi:MAG: helix-turn-helix domain-containing protein [Candidatus Dormibacteraceae bacterium]
MAKSDESYRSEHSRDHLRAGDRSPGYTSAEQLLSGARRDPGLPQETVRTYIVRLRRKLAERSAPVQIANRSRRGCSLVFDDRPSESAYHSVT